MKKELINGARYLSRGVKKKTPLLLTIGTILGVGSVIVTTVKATLKTKEDLETAEEEKGEELDKIEVAKIVAKDCWPVAATTALTLTMTISNHKINANRIQTATLAYEFYRDTYETYKGKVREKLGKDQDRIIDSEIARDKIVDFDPETVPNIGHGSVLFIEGVTGQVFRSSVDYIRQCEKQFNQYELKGSDWAPFNNWLIMLGLRPMESAVGDYLGFSERFEHDGLNITLTPSNEVFGTGETATIITYEDPLCTEGDFRVLDW